MATVTYGSFTIERLSAVTWKLVQNDGFGQYVTTSLMLKVVTSCLRLEREALTVGFCFYLPQVSIYLRDRWHGQSKCPGS